MSGGFIVCVCVCVIVIMLWGGEPKGHAVAQEDSWKRILNFLKEHLCIQPTLAPQAKL